jgi:hypothetical protein
MSKDDRGPYWLLPAVYYLAYVLMLVLYWFAYALDEAWHRAWLQGEDKLAEFLTLAAFFLAFATMSWTLWKYRAFMGRWTRLYLGGVALFCFVCAGEEISWAQRVIGFDTPDTILNRNEQREFNLHNLDFEHIHPQAIAALFMEGFGIVLPILGCRHTFRPSGRWRRYVAPFYMVPCFAFAESLTTVQRLLKPWLAEKFGKDVMVVVRSDTRELTEMFWGLCLWLSACAICAAWRRHAAEARSP